MPSPYNADPPNASIQAAADGIFYGVKGVLLDTDCTDALKEIISDGMSDGYDKILVNHPDGLKVELNPADIEQGIYDAFVQLAADGITPNTQQWGRLFSLVAVAASSLRKTSFLSKTDLVNYERLAARVTQMQEDALQP